MAKTLIDPLTRLSLSLVENRGVFALLIGSGASKSAGILTGWEITINLIKKIAAAEAKDCSPDPASWYKQTYGEEPGYARLLHQLGNTQEERNQILRGYFEPTEEERENGVKMPTACHQAIARLVAKGYVKVILTTNFDRLLEIAIEAEGATPVVLSTPDAIEGSLPLIHQTCCIVKLHGDYRDKRIKNTPQELAEYDPAIDQFLARVFDEFGLIVCGWSGEWDTALRSAIDRNPSRRFSVYWTSLGDPVGHAAALIHRRGAQPIKISEADAFFQELANKVDAIEASAAPHPLTTIAAVGMLKKFIAEPRFNVRLRDLIAHEAEKFHTAIWAFNHDLIVADITDSKIPGIYTRYFELGTTLIELFNHGCFWSRADTDEYFGDTLQAICRQPALTPGRSLSNGITHYPILLMLYSAAISATGAKKYGLLYRLLTRPRLRNLGEVAPLVAALDFPELNRAASAIYPNRHFPLSEHLFEIMREPLRAYLPDDDDFSQTFDRYEYLQSLLYADLNRKGDDIPAWGGHMGRFALGSRHRTGNASIMDQIGNEIRQMGPEWPPLKAGFFRGSPDRLNTVSTMINKIISHQRLGSR